MIGTNHNLVISALFYLDAAMFMWACYVSYIRFFRFMRQYPLTTYVYTVQMFERSKAIRNLGTDGWTFYQVI